MARSLQVTIVGDASRYSRALGDASRATSSFGSGLGRVAKTAALAVGAAGIGGIAVVLKAGISEWVQSTKVAAQTGAVLKSTGGAANVTAKEVDNLAHALMRKSGIDDEVIKTGENMLLTFTNIRNEVGKGNDIFSRATTAITDMDTAMTHGNSTQESLAKTAILVGKALNDPIKGATALRRVGVQLTDAQEKQIAAFVKSGDVMSAQKIILGELTKEFGGSAKAMGDTLPGKINILRESFKNLAANLITQLIPTFERLIKFITEHMPEIQAVTTRVFSAIGSIIGSAARLIQTHWQTITRASDILLGALRGVVRFLSTDIGQGVAIAAGSLFGLIQAFAAVRSGAALLGKSLTLNPTVAAIGIAVTLIGTAALKLAASKSGPDKLRDAFSGLADAVRNAKSALDGLVQSDLTLESANLRVVETHHAQQAALENLNKVRGNAKSSTLEIKQAEDLYKRSVLDSRQAVAEQTTAQKGQTESTKALTSSYTEHVGKLQELIGKNEASISTWEKATGSTKEMAFMQERVDKVLASTTATLGTGATAMEAYAVKIAGVDPKAAIAAIKIRDLDLATKDFIATHGRLPTKTELEILIKKVQTNDFVGELKKVQVAAFTTARVATQDLQSGLAPMAGIAGKAASAAVTAVRGQVGPAGAAGSAVGQALGHGVEAGINVTVGNVVRAAFALASSGAAAARRALEAQSPSRVMMQVGRDFGLGLATGIVGTAARIAAGVKQISTGMVKGISEPLRLLGPALLKSLTTALAGATKSAGAVAVRGMNDVGKLIVAAAKKYGVDARAALAVAMTEGGIKFGAVGDSGHSFGPFQMADFGALAGRSTASAKAFANSVAGIDFALRKMAESGAKGLTGLAAIKAIIGGPGWGFERPANAAASVAKAFEFFKTLGPEVAGAVAKAGPMVSGQLRQIAALVRQYAPLIGLEQARGVIAGLVQAQPTFLQTAKAKMVEALAAQRQAVIEAKGSFVSAFNELANAALTAFDTRWAAWVPPAQRLLDKMQLAEQVKQVQDQLATAMTAVTGGGAFDASVLSKQLGESLAGAMSQALGSIAGAKTEEALNRVAAQVQTQVLAAIDATAATATTQAQAAVDAAKTALTAAQATGDPDAILAAQTALDTAVGNQQKLEAAILAEKELALGQLLAAEQRRHDAIGVKQREGLAKQLAELKIELLKHPEEWNTMGVNVQRILTGFNVKLQTAGHAWADKFGDGIRAGIPAAVAAAEELARRVAAALPSTSSPLKPAKTGPLSFHPRTMGKAWATSFASGLASGNMGNIVGALVSGAPMPVAGGVVAAGAGGGMVINLTVHAETDNPARLAQALVEPIRRELYRTKSRNGSLDF